MPFWSRDLSPEEFGLTLRTGTPKSVADVIRRMNRTREGTFDFNLIELNPMRGECIDALLPLIARSGIWDSAVRLLSVISRSQPRHEGAMQALAPLALTNYDAAEVIARWADSREKDLLLQIRDHPRLSEYGRRGLERLRDMGCQLTWWENERVAQALPPDELARACIDEFRLGGEYTRAAGQHLAEMAGDPSRRPYAIRAIPVLVELLRPGTTVVDSRKYTSLLASIGGKETVDALVDAYRTATGGVRSVIIPVLAQLCQPSDIVALGLLSEAVAVEANGVELRILAAKALIRCGHYQIGEKLAEMTLQGVKDEIDAWKVGQLVAACRLESLLEPMLEFAGRNGGRAARTPVGAVAALGGYVDPRAVRMLLALVQQRNSARVGGWAAEALGMVYKRPDLSPDMRRLIDDHRQCVVFVDDGPEVKYIGSETDPSRPLQEIEVEHKRTLGAFLGPKP